MVSGSTSVRPCRGYDPVAPAPGAAAKWPGDRGACTQEVISPTEVFSDGGLCNHPTCRVVVINPEPENENEVWEVRCN